MAVRETERWGEVASDEWREKRRNKDNAETQKARRFAGGWQFMSKDRRMVLRFAAVGFGIAVLFFGFQMLIEPSPWSRLNNILSAIFMILCPPVLLLFNVEVGIGGFYVLWMVVALSNAAVYAVIGAAYVGLRKKREGPASG
jgi:hypothetical protein